MMTVDQVKPLKALDNEALIASGITSSDPYLSETAKRLAEAHQSDSVKEPWRCYRSALGGGFVVASGRLENKVIASGLSEEAAKALTNAHNGYN